MTSLLLVAESKAGGYGRSLCIHGKPQLSPAMKMQLSKQKVLPSNTQSPGASCTDPGSSSKRAISCFGVCLINARQEWLSLNKLWHHTFRSLCTTFNPGLHLEDCTEQGKMMCYVLSRWCYLNTKPCQLFIRISGPSLFDVKKRHVSPSWAYSSIILGKYQEEKLTWCRYYSTNLESTISELFIEISFFGNCLPLETCFKQYSHHTFNCICMCIPTVVGGPAKVLS